MFFSMVLTLSRTIALDAVDSFSMDRRLIVSLIVVMLLLIPAQGHAEAGWTSVAPVAELTSTNQLRYLVTLKVTANPSGCRNRVVFYQDHRSLGSEQMFRLLLEAASTGSMVRVHVTGNCELNGYSEISSVSLIP